ncbi:MAG: cytochrome d ubiquinol oxidase subunit II [Gluconacetobacter diazotrophicus]|nr:cytochrome d ubiquinol oxidase subunit II [Gluconacetobacter diazotrophicus]
MDPLDHVQHILAIGWWLAVAVCMVLYVILDGADLGAGIFSLFVPEGDERAAIMQAMAGTWDANETWLIVAGGILFGSFPFAYGSVFSYLMIPLLLVLWGILTRAVALEFRHLAEPRWKRFTDWAFGLSSLAVTFFGGISVGAVLHGFPLTHRDGTVPAYVGGAFRFLSPFSVWTGVAAVLAVSLAGGLFVRARFEPQEPIRRHAARWTNVMFFLALPAVPLSVLFIALSFPWAARSWFGPQFWLWALIPLAAIATTVLMRRATERDRDLAALLWLDATIVIMAGGLLGTTYPFIVPDTWTVEAAASREISLFTFGLTIVFLFPVMLMYNWYQIWVFRARVAKLASYHA